MTGVEAKFSLSVAPHCVLGGMAFKVPSSYIKILIYPIVISSKSGFQTLNSYESLMFDCILITSLLFCLPDSILSSWIDKMVLHNYEYLPGNFGLSLYST